MGILRKAYWWLKYDVGYWLMLIAFALCDIALFVFEWACFTFYCIGLFLGFVSMNEEEK